MKYNGFTFVEVIFSFGLLLVVMLSTLPIIMKVNMEDAILADRRTAITILHDELIQAVNEPMTESRSYLISDFADIQIIFEVQGKIMKGCADWTNKQNQKEMVCLYGYRKT